MSLAQRYRLQFSQPRHRWMAVYGVAAISLHLGMLAVGLGWWANLRLPPFPDPSAAQPPIEFIPVDGLETSPPLDTERTAIRDSVAGGVQAPDVPVGAEESGSESPAPSQRFQARSPTTPPATDALRPEPVRPPLPSDSTNVRPSRNPPSLQSAPPQASPPPVPIERPSSPNSVNTSAGSASDLLPEASSALTADGSSVVNPNRTATGAIGVDATRDSVWAPYLEQLRQQIRQSWQLIGLDNSREVEVRFVVDRQGHLVSSSVVRSSGSSRADNAALQAIQMAAPFNPLPSEAPEPSLIVNFTFTYTVR